MSEKCVICDQHFDDSGADVSRVSEKGLLSLSKASKERNDNKVHCFVGIKFLTVHTLCRKKYTRTDSIQADLKRQALASTSQPKEDSNKTVGLRSSHKFDFKTKCFLCTISIDDDFKKKEGKKPLCKRRKWWPVRTFNIQKASLEAGLARKDKWGDEVVGRISSITDLVAEEAVYHDDCRKNFCRLAKTSNDESTDHVTAAMEEIYAFMEENNDSQFTLPEIRNAVTGPVPDDKTIKKKLVEKFGDRVTITVGSNRYQLPIICFTDTAHKILSDSWYEKKANNMHDERLRIVTTAAKIIRQDIQHHVYNSNTYPPADNFLQNTENSIPSTLLTFLREVMINKRNTAEQIEKKCLAISHAIVAAVRPRSFMSSIMTSLALLIYRKFASKTLVNLISSLGFCSSYHDAQNLEISAMVHSQPRFKAGSFTQFVFDNADFNVCTLDGMNTFHSMGGIKCITPASSTDKGSEIPKLSKMPSSKESGLQGVIPVEAFHAEGKGLQNVIVQDLVVPEEASCPTAHDVLWLYAKWKGNPNVPEWKGYMHSITKGMYSEKTKVIPLPFINAPPSDYDTVYTALKYAAMLCDEMKQHCPIVTFDQPLYLKSREIVAASPPDSTVSKCVVRLGGFHLLMSFLGSIGYLMGGSGLKELLSTVYAPTSVDHILQGRAFARAVRAHILVQTALSRIIFGKMAINDNEQKFLDELLIDFLDESPSLKSLKENSCVRALADLMGEQTTKLSLHGPTAKLWIQYFYMVSLMKEYIHAERSGNWESHIDCVKKMTPYFHASGHFPYAKSCQLYVQDMMDLPSKLTPEEYCLFTTEGYFTMRRSDIFWTGVWSDMTIETTLMRGFKSRGGLTRGRGITDSVISKWILGTPATHDICISLEEFSGVLFATSEQHKDCGTYRKTRDAADIQKISQWFENHDPFCVTEDIISIATGVVGDDTITCYKAVAMGKAAMEKIVGTPFSEVKLTRKDCALPLSSVTSSIKIQGEPVVIDPLLIFQRISISKQTDEDLKQYLQYELAPFPLALFDEAGMRKTKKAVLYNILKPTLNNNLQDFDIVIDGGFLLHRVIWLRGSTISTICEAYVNYIYRHYNGKSCTIVFDGYNSSNATTKTAEHRRRYRTKKSVDVKLNEDTVITIEQGHFLSNDHNKSQLIAILSAKLQTSGIEIRQAPDDADTLIISTAIEISKTSSNVVVVGEDVDLLILLMATTPENQEIIFFKPGRRKTEASTYSSKELQQLGLRHILFLHAFTGCDTTSAAFRKGKVRFVKLYQKSAHIQNYAEVFTNPTSSQSDIEEAGSMCFLKWYGAPANETSLNSFRYHSFVKSVTNMKPDISALPPTEGAAKQHSFRVYLQVQAWLGNKLPPTLWGWKVKQLSNEGDQLEPLPTTDLSAPQEVLTLIFCKCNKGCGGAKCSCKKAGMNCSPICHICHGSCLNSVPYFEDEPDEYETFPIDSDATELLEVQDDPVPCDEPLPGPSRPKRSRIN